MARAHIGGGMIAAIHLFFTDAAYFKSAMITFFVVAFILLLVSPLIAMLIHWAIEAIKGRW